MSTILIFLVGAIIAACGVLQWYKGIERDIKTASVEKEIQNIKISVAELKISTDKIDKNVEILLTRGLYERDNR
jgi:hypothetical protein